MTASTSSGTAGTSPAFRRVMRYLWDPEKQNTDHENRIVVLGEVYDPKVYISAADDSSKSELSNAWPEDFLEDVESRIWMTYRTGFQLIPKAKKGPSALSLGGILRGSGIDPKGFTSDVGWGCMIRTGQSLLANSLMKLKFGRQWRHSAETASEQELDVVKWFADDPSQQFSLHKFVEHGESYCGKMPGEWFGPSAAASSIKALCGNARLLNVYVSHGSDVYENQVMREAVFVEEGKQVFKPLLILLGIRLGIDQVNPLYWEGLKSLLTFPQSVGIAGGRPSSSHYFFGFQGDYLFYLDPHLPRPALKTDELAEMLDTVHTRKIRALHLNEVDPSMLVGFLIEDEKDWDDWKQRVAAIESRSIISVSAREPLINCNSSVSVGSDNDDNEFIDIGLGTEESDFVSDTINDEPAYSGDDQTEDEEQAVDVAAYVDKQRGNDESRSPEDDEEVLVGLASDASESFESTATRCADYDVPVMVESSDMLPDSNNSSYVEASSFGVHASDSASESSDTATANSRILSRASDDDWDDMK